MQPLGEPSNSRKLLLYQERDTIGLEDPGVAPPTDFSGWNEGAAWTRRIGVTHNVEHDTYGIHQTPKIASLFLVMVWDQANGIYKVGVESYIQDQSDTGQAPYVGSSAVTFVAAGGGLVTITIKAGYLFRSSDLALHDFHMSDVPLKPEMKDYSQVNMARVMIDSTFATTTTTFQIRRFEGPEPGSLSQTDGFFCIAVSSR